MEKNKITKNWIQFLNYNHTIGVLNKGEERKFTRKFRKVGALQVSLLKEYLKILKDSDQIGIYINKRNKLVPIHCKRKLLAPIVVITSKERKCQEVSEFEPSDNTGGGKG